MSVARIAKKKKGQYLVCVFFGLKLTFDDDGSHTLVLFLRQVAKNPVFGRECKRHGARVVFEDRNVVVHDGHLGRRVHLVQVVDAGMCKIVAQRCN